MPSVSGAPLLTLHLPSCRRKNMRALWSSRLTYEMEDIINTHTRRAVAYIAGRLVSSRKSSSIYDYDEGRYVNMSGNLTGKSVSAYDYDQRCYISGSSTSLYHYGNRAHLTLKLNVTKFSGYDYDSGKHFSGNVNDKNVSLYDYETGKHYSYSI
jgi:hypothetical protein